MVIGSAEVTLRCPWVTSLKEKRMVIKSLCSRVTNKFNVSAAEVGMQDDLKTIVVGFACVSNEYVHAENTVEKVLSFIAGATDAEIIDILTHYD